MTLLANMYVPSFVQLLTGPLFWSFLIITMVVTVPVIFVISLIEALVLKRFVSGRRLWTLLWRLALLNAFTSLLGTYFTWPGPNLWPGLALAFVCTVPVEAGLLWLGWFGLPKGYPALGYLKASAAMNVASYAFLAIVLAGLIYLPTLGKEDRALAKAVSGKIVVADINGLDTIDLQTGRLIQGKEPPHPGDFQPWDFNLTQDGSLYALGGTEKDTREAARYIWLGGAWRKSEIDLPRQTEGLIAISPDRQFLLYAAEPASYIKRVVTGQTAHTALPANLERGSFSADDHFLLFEKRGSSNDTRLIDLLTKQEIPLPEAGAATFNPVRPELAWIVGDKAIVIYDCLTGKRRMIHLSGSIASVSSVAWSPDGKYLAYLGDVNPFTRQRFTPNLRVVEVASGKSATVYRDLGTAGWSTRLFWLK